MKHIAPYINPEHISNSLEISNIEKYIPENLRNQVELDLIINQGARSIHRCYEHIANGTISIGSISSPELTKLKEACTALVNDIKQTLNEQNTANPPTQIEGDNVNNVMDGISDAQMKAASAVAGEEPQGFISLITGLLSTLTEGGSPIGILHIILDIIGIFGDALLPGLGVVADILNAIIYLYRAEMDTTGKNGHMYLLSLLSLLGAIPVGGMAADGLKALLKGSKGGKAAGKITSEFFRKGTVGSTKMTDDAVKLTAAAKPETIKALEGVSLASGKVASLAGNILDTFFTKFLAKISSIIPGIGKPLEKFFKHIGGFFSSFQRKAANFAKEMPKTIKMAEVLKLDNFFKAANVPGNKLFTRGNNLILKDAGGKVVAKLEGGLLKSSDALLSKFGPVTDDAVKAIIGNTEKSAVAFYKSMGTVLNRSRKYQDKMINFGGRVFKYKIKIPLFIGKQTVKIIREFGKNGDAFNNLSDDETELIGVAAMQNMMHDKIRQERIDNPDATGYIAPITDSMNDLAAFQVMNKTLDDQAKTMNMPRIWNIVANRAAMNTRDKDIQDFIEAVGPEVAVKRKQRSKNTSEEAKLKFIKRP